jgi:hypothetical protein
VSKPTTDVAAPLPPLPPRYQVRFNPSDADSSYLTDVPQELREYFLANDCDVFFARNDPNSAAQQGAWRRMTVLWDDLPADLQKQIHGHFEDPTKNGGVLKRGDGILYAIPLAAREHFRGIIRMNIEKMMNDSDHRAEDLNERLQKNAVDANAPKGFVQIKRGPGGSIDQQAIGGPALLATMARGSTPSRG